MAPGLTDHARDLQLGLAARVRGGQADVARVVCLVAEPFRRIPRGAPIERLVARLPLILPLLGLALLLQVALGERERAGLLWAGLPCVLVLIAYVRSGRGARKGRAFTDAT